MSINWQNLASFPALPKNEGQRNADDSTKTEKELIDSLAEVTQAVRDSSMTFLVQGDPEPVHRWKRRQYELINELKARGILK